MTQSDEYQKLIEENETLKRENKKLEKSIKDKRQIIGALTEHLKLKYEYSDRRIFNIIELYKKKNEKY